MHYSLDKKTRLRLTEKFHSEKPIGNSMNSNLATRPTTSRSVKKSNDQSRNSTAVLKGGAAVRLNLVNTPQSSILNQLQSMNQLQNNMIANGTFDLSTKQIGLIRYS